MGQWHRDIGEALQRCDWFLVGLSPSALKSIWVERELTYALCEAKYDRAITPLLLRTCNWKRSSWLFGLRGLKLIDFRKSFEDGCRELLRLWEA